MHRTGFAHLRLHGGHAPPWLYNRMVRLGGSIMEVMVSEYGSDGVLARLSDPFFFQSLSNALGFDWNSSGTTTVLCGVLQKVFNESRTDLGLRVVGGKGGRSRKTPSELAEVAENYSLAEDELFKLRYASRMAAKVDSSAIQAGYQLYHHSMLVSSVGEWAVVQQGMNPDYKTARRYHWLSDKVEKNFVEEPHAGLVGEMSHEKVLNLTSRESRDCRKTILDIVKDNPKHVQNLFDSISHEGSGKKQKTLLNWAPENRQHTLKYSVPSRMNWGAVERAYQLQPEKFEGLLDVEGIGPATVRGLTLVSELIYGEAPSWKDPVKYSFAFGGKDGVPFPVKRREYDKASEILEEAIRQSKLGDYEKLEAIRRLPMKTMDNKTEKTLERKNRSHITAEYTRG